MIKSFYRKWILLAAVIAVAFLFGVKTRVGLYFFFFWCALFFAVLNIIAVFFTYALAQLSLERRHMHKTEEEENLKIEIILRNKSFFPLVNIVVEDAPLAGLQEEKSRRISVEYIPGNSMETVTYNCYCHKRGLYRLRNFTIYFFDPFGFFYFKKTYPVATEFYVFPKIFHIAKFPQMKKGALPWFGIDTGRTTGDDDEYFGVREYRPGDVISKIHWLSSARHNSLIVKQFQRQNFYRATILFALEKKRDYGTGKESVSEYMVKIAASVAKYLLEHNVALELIAHTDEFVHIPLKKGADQLDDMMTFFATARPESPIGLGEVFEDYFHFIPDDSNVIVIMLDEDWEYFMRMLPLEKRNMYFVPLVLVASTFKYAFNTPEVVRDVQSKLAGEINCAPLFISRGNNFEETFLKAQR